VHLDPGRIHDAFTPEKTEHGGHGVDVPERWDVAKKTLSVGKQGRRKDGKRGILRPAHLDGAR
jgi:hypothetical protein